MGPNILIYLTYLPSSSSPNNDLWCFSLDKGLEGNNFIATLLTPFRKVQNIGLKRIASAYRAASILNLK